MFAHLRGFERIFVIGPQRSGTTICGQMIAADTGLRYHDEFDWAPPDSGLVYSFETFARYVRANTGVFQCPTMTAEIIAGVEPIGAMLPRSLVVIPLRDLVSIWRSQERVGWSEGWSAQELRRLSRPPSSDYAYEKYALWHRGPKPPHYLEVHYESLRAHPLWVDAEHRQDFTLKQTRRSDA